METRRSVSFSLPWPQWVNEYWKPVRVGSFCKVISSAKAKRYAEEVDSVIWHRFGTLKPIECEVEIEVGVVLPDRRKRDLDNILKGPLDGLSKAGFWADDSLVRRITIERSGEVEKPGRLDVTVTECVPFAEPTLF